MFENHRKSLIQRVHKSYSKRPIKGLFGKPKASVQTVLPDNRAEIGGKCPKFKGDVFK